MWKNFLQSKDATCSLSKYKRIFYNHFNLGFGNPHEDTCLTCKELTIESKRTKDLEKKNELRTTYRLHKARAKKFFQLLNDHKEGTIKICFDCQQNQPLPKVSFGEVFFLRQVWLYNLGIVQHEDGKQSKDNICHYTWLETEASRGSNEIASGLQNYLKELEEKMILEKKQS